MALGILFIIFIVSLILVVLAQIFLYAKQKTGNIIFLLNMVLGILLSYMAYTALSDNYTGQKIVSLIWGIIAVVAIVLKLTNNKAIFISKLLLTVSLIGALIQLFF